MATAAPSVAECGNFEEREDGAASEGGTTYGVEGAWSQYKTALSVVYWYKERVTAHALLAGKRKHCKCLRVRHSPSL